MDKNNPLFKYLVSQVQWSINTQKATQQQLEKYEQWLHDPLDLWEATHHLAPYSRTVLFNRVHHFHDWMVRNGIKSANLFTTFLKHNRKLAQSLTYQPRLPDITYAEAKAKLLTIGDEEIRNKALQLLNGGLRYTESFTIDSEGFIKGKGGKQRKVFVKPVTYTKSYKDLLMALQPLGLTPHVLRKVMATELARRGVSVFDLTKAMGWSSVQTAMCYVAGLPDEQMNNVFTSITNEGDKDDETKPVLTTVREAS